MLWLRFQLRFGRSLTRRNVVRKLRGLRSSKAIDLLTGALQDPDEDVFEDALRGLRDVGDARVADALLSIARAWTGKRSHEAALVLGELGDVRVLPMLFDLLAPNVSNRRYEYRNRATHRIEKIRDPAATECFLSEITFAIHHPQEADVYRVKTAIDALATFQDARSIEPLLTLATGSETQFSVNALSALSKCADERVIVALLALLRNFITPQQPSDHDRYRALEAVKILTQLREPRAVELLVALATTERLCFCFDKALSALTTLGDARAVEPLAEALNQNPHRADLVKALGEFGDPRAAEALTASLAAATPGSAEALVKVLGSDALGTLVTIFMTGDTAVRQKAARALQGLNWRPADACQRVAYAAAQGRCDDAIKEGKVGVAALCTALSYYGYDHRRSAIAALREIGGSEVIETLTQCVTSSSSAIEEAEALVSLGVITSPITDVLIWALKDKNRSKSDKHRIANALGNSQDARAIRPILDVGAYDSLPAFGAVAVAPLIDVLRDWYAKEHHVEAAAHLARIGDQQCLDALFEVSRRHLDYKVRNIALLALCEKQDPRAIEGLIDQMFWYASSPDNIKHYLGKLAVFGEQAIGALVEVLCDPDGRFQKVPKPNKDDLTPQQFTNILEAVSKTLGAKATPALVTATVSAPTGRGRAADVLEKSGDLRTIELLTEELSAAPPGTRAEAVRLLARLGRLAALETLVSVLRTGTSEERKAGAGALALCGKETPVETALLQALADTDNSVQDEAMRALGEVGGCRSIAPLLTMIRNEDGTQRYVAHIALDKIQGSGVNEALLDFLEDCNNRQECRCEAAERLGNARESRATPVLIGLLDEDPALQCVAAEALAKIGDGSAVRPLLECLTRGGQLQRLVVEALGRIGDKSVVGPLLTLLQRGESVHEVAQALGRIGDQAAVLPLMDALERCKSRADSPFLWALVEIGDPRCVPLVAPVLTYNRSPSSQVALEKLLANFPTLFDHSQLTELSTAPNLTHLEGGYHMHTDDMGYDWGPMVGQTLVTDADFSKVRTLARDELLRRGSLVSAT